MNSTHVGHVGIIITEQAPRHSPLVGDDNIDEANGGAWRDFVENDCPEHENSATLERGDDVELATKLVESLKRKFSGHVVCDGSEDLFAYDATSGLWRKIPEALQSTIVQGFAGTVVHTGRTARALRVSAASVAGARKLARDQVTEEGFFENAPDGIAFTNGFLRVSADGAELAPKSPDHRARVGLSFEYDDQAECPQFAQFLADVWQQDEDSFEKENFLQEFVGIALVGAATRFQRCVVLTGEGANGKGTLIEILNELFPADLSCSIPPQDWGNDYKKAMLAGRRWNNVTELPVRDISDSEAFKGVIAGDPMVARPIRQAPFTFRPQAAHVFSANRLPGTQDTTYAFWRRFVILEFNRRFEKATADKDIASKVKIEVRGITRWAIEGTIRALQRGHFEVPESSEKRLESWKAGADHVRRFVDESCERGGMTSATELYKLFVVWWGEEGLTQAPPSKQAFSQRMRAIGFESKHTNSGNIYPVTIKTEVKDK